MSPLPRSFDKTLTTDFLTTSRLPSLPFPSFISFAEAHGYVTTVVIDDTIYFGNVPNAKPSEIAD